MKKADVLSALNHFQIVVQRKCGFGVRAVKVGLMKLVHLVFVLFMCVTIVNLIDVFVLFEKKFS